MNDGKSRYSQVKENLREFVTSRPILKECLKETLQRKESKKGKNLEVKTKIKKTW